MNELAALEARIAQVEEAHRLIAARLELLDQHTGASE